MFIHQELTDEPVVASKKSEISAFRVVLALAVMAVAALLVFLLADWAQLHSAIQDIKGHP